MIETSWLIGKIISRQKAVNNNPVPKEDLRNKNLEDVLWILWLIQKLAETEAKNRKEFLQELGKLNAEWKLNSEIYAQKYKLTLILEIPELSTWDAIFSGLERKYPEWNWIEEAA
jgi:hypothetical protein